MAWLSTSVLWLVIPLSFVGCGARSGSSETDPPPADIVAPPLEEFCNGRDDDGDGQIDEDIPDIACGVGACRRTAPGCINGAPAVCQTGTPSPESCNSIDDDCDGSVDEDLPFGLVSGPVSVAGEAFRAGNIVPTNDGLLVGWRIGFNGSAPMPTGFVRRLDSTGIPSGMAEQLWPDPVVLGPSLFEVTDGRIAAAVCRRNDTFDAPSFRFIDQQGMLVGDEHPVFGSDEQCTTSDTPPQMLWTGERLHFVWMTSTNSLMVAHTSDANGLGGTSGFIVTDGGDLGAPPRLARFGERMAIVAGIRPTPQESVLRVMLRDLSGNVIEDVDLPTPGQVAAYGQPRVAVDDDGVMLIVATNRSGPGWIRARVSFQGDIVSAAELVDEDVDVREVKKHADGGFWAVTMNGSSLALSLLRLDEQGQEIERFLLPGNGAWPVMTPHDGRVTVAYTNFVGNETDELHAVTYGCL